MARLGDVASGALTGAGAGSMFGPWGAGIGALGGGLLGLFGGGTESRMKPYNKKSLSMLQSLLSGGGLEGNQLYGAGSNYLQNLLSGEPGAFSAFEAPYISQFEQSTVPTIAERFAGMGTGAGAGSSSALNQTLAQAGSGLSRDLASLRNQLQMQALPQAYQYAQGPIQNMLAAAGLIPSQYYEIPGQAGMGQGILGGVSSGIGQGYGTAFGNKYANMF